MDTYSIYDMLGTIRKRPAMYAGGDLGSLMSYVRGYAHAMDNVGVRDASDPPFCGFHEYVRAKYQYRESTAGWANMINAIVLGKDPTNISWEHYDRDMVWDQKKTAFALSCGRRNPVEYGSDDWQRFCSQHNLEPSMSRKGNCWDNAVAESFFSSLKKERIKKRV